MDYNTYVPFFIGLASLLHCVGMCGGIIGALTMSLPQYVRENPLRLSSFIAAYNMGRISSYALVGSVLGYVSMSTELFNPEYGRTLQIISALFLAAIGLYIAGWFPAFARVEKLGSPLWKYLEPVGRKLLPVKSHSQAYLFGMIWGWLPCGLVYSTFVWVLASSTSPTQAAFSMVLFGLGTLPGVMTAGILTGWLAQLRKAKWSRQVFGLLLISMALVSLYVLYSSQASAHHH